MQAGGIVKNRINAGLQCTLWDLFRLSASSLRGNDWAASVALELQSGESPKVFPKYKDPPPLIPPSIQSLSDSFEDRNLPNNWPMPSRNKDLTSTISTSFPAENGKDQPLDENCQRPLSGRRGCAQPIEYVLAALTPSNISTVTAVTEAEGVPIHEYRFRMEDLQPLWRGEIGRR